MKITKQLLWIGIVAVMLASTAASCEGGKNCDCPKFGQADVSGNDAVAAAAAAGTLD